MSEGVSKTGAITLKQHGGFQPQNLDEAYRLAKYMSQSNLVPREYFKKEADILVAMQWGAELGLAPLQALQNIAVINGRPSIWGDAALALVRASGLMETFDEQIVRDDKEGLTAICTSKRVGDKTLHERKFSERDRDTAGLTGRGTHKTYPKRMLQMRARGFLLRDVYPDALKGLVTREEAEDYQVGKAKDVTPEPEELKALPEQGEVNSENENEKGEVHDFKDTESAPEEPVEMEVGEPEAEADDVETGERHGEADEPEQPKDRMVDTEKVNAMHNAVTKRRRYGWSIKRIEERYGKSFNTLTAKEFKELADALKSCGTNSDAVADFLVPPTSPTPEDLQAKEPEPSGNEFLVEEVRALLIGAQELGIKLADMGIPEDWEALAPTWSDEILKDLIDSVQEFIDEER